MVKLVTSVFMKMTATYEVEQKQLERRIIELQEVMAGVKEKSAYADAFLKMVPHIHRYSRIGCRNYSYLCETNQCVYCRESRWSQIPAYSDNLQLHWRVSYTKAEKNSIVDISINYAVF